MKIISLFVRHGSTAYPRAYQAFHDLLARQALPCSASVLIDTAIPVGHRVFLGSGAVLVGGDNQRREFSGWDTAIRLLGDRLDDYDVAVIGTSAFQNDYNGFYKFVRPEIFEFVKCNPSIVIGHMDAYPESVRLCGRSFQTWLCSKFLVINPSMVKAVLGFVSPVTRERLFSTDPCTPFAEDAPLSDNYQRYLVEWLTGEGLPHGKWHSTFGLSESTLSDFQFKALSIIDEHSLSMRLREASASLHDVTWLEQAGWGASALGSTDELLQVQQRNEYLFDQPLIERSLDLAEAPAGSGENPATRVLECGQSPGAAPFQATELVRALWQGNRELRAILRLDDPVHLAALYLNQGLALSANQLRWLKEADSDAKTACGLRMTRGLSALWLARKDLSEAFDIRGADGRDRFLGWWVRHRRAREGISELVSPGALQQPDDTFPQDLPLPVTHGLHAIWHTRDDLQESIDLRQPEGRIGFISWWMKFGRFEPENSGLVSRSVYEEPSPWVEQDAPLPITRGLHALWYARDDLRGQMNLAEPVGRLALITWWMRHGRIDAQNFELMAEAVYAENSPFVEQDVPLPITLGLHALWHTRDDLQKSIDLQRLEGRKSFVSWWMKFGRFEPENRGLVSRSVYEEVSPWVEQDAPLTITRGLHALWSARDDLRGQIDLAESVGRAKLATWWMAHGRIDTQNAGLMPEAVYAEPSPLVEQDAPLPITRGLHALWLSRDDLRRAFDLAASEGRASYAAWADQYRPLGSNLIRAGDIPRSSVRSEPTPAAGRRAFGGVNLIGFGRGQLGIGEDMRMASRALRLQDFDHCVPRLRLKHGAGNLDTTLACFETGAPQYRINMVFLPNYEILRLLGAGDVSLFEGRFTIGCPQWELPKFPAGLEISLDLLDELWVSSQYTADAMRTANREKTVIVMPMAVELPRVRGSYSRRDFALPDDDFVFLTVLDGNSSVRRKNPLGTLKAFQTAFPDNSESVRLVIKSMNMPADSDDWGKVLELATADNRVTLIQETWPRDRLQGLQQVSDCFVSLHRAEGFGRNIAEAMLMRMPVIVTAHSGNADFCDSESALVVDGRPAAVTEDDYPFAKNQYWWEPDVEEAASHMQRCFYDKEKRLTVALAGWQRITANHAPAVVGRRYLSRLVELGLV